MLLDPKCINEIFILSLAICINDVLLLDDSGIKFHDPSNIQNHMEATKGIANIYV